VALLDVQTAACPAALMLMVYDGMSKVSTVVVDPLQLLRQPTHSFICHALRCILAAAAVAGLCCVSY
jgi:hypothetical protein